VPPGADQAAGAEARRQKYAHLTGASAQAPSRPDTPAPSGEQPRGADHRLPPPADQATGAEARRQKYAHLTGASAQAPSRPDTPARHPGETGQASSPESRQPGARSPEAHPLPDQRSPTLEDYQGTRNAAPPAPHTDHPQGAGHASGADRTGTHRYPEGPPQLPAEPGRPADSSDGERRAAVEDVGPGDPPEPDEQGTATGQETPASRQGANSREAAGPADTTELAEAPNRSEPQDSVADGDVTEALQRRIAELEAANAELEAKSAAKDAVIVEQHEAIEAKDAAITDRDAAMAEKDAMITGQWRAISELGNRIDDLADENANLKAEKATHEADKADPPTQNVEAPPDNASPVAEKAGLPVAPEGGNAAPDASQEQPGAPPPDKADQELVNDKAGTTDEEQASQTASIDSRNPTLPAQEQEKPTAGRGWRRLVPSNELAAFVGGGAAGLGITIADVTHLMGDGWSAITVAAAGLAVSGVALVNKIWKKDGDGSRSQG
jgi:hypothetical protein